MGRNRKVGAALALCALVGLTACGDDDDVSSSGDASEITSGGADTTGAASDDTSAATDAPKDTGASSGEFDGDFCAQTAQMMDEFDDFDLDTEDFGAISDRFTEMLDAVNRLGEKAPEELKDDFETMSASFEEMKDILPRLSEMMAAVNEAGTDQEKLNQVMEEYGDLMDSDALTTLDSAELEQAGQNISDYVRDVCGLDVGS